MDLESMLMPDQQEKEQASYALNTLGGQMELKQAERPDLLSRLKMRRAEAAKQAMDLDKAVKALEAHPDLADVINLISKVRY